MFNAENGMDRGVDMTISDFETSMFSNLAIDFSTITFNTDISSSIIVEFILGKKTNETTTRNLILKKCF
jgi:hypothetical protein